MNWFKQSQNIQSLEDRNAAIRKMNILKQARDRLQKCQKLVFMAQGHTKGILEEYMDDKTLSSHEAALGYISQAAAVALDSPYSASEMLKKAVEDIDRIIENIQGSISKYTQGRPSSGWFRNKDNKNDENKANSKDQ